LRNESQGRAAAAGFMLNLGPGALRVPVEVRIEGGSKVPIFSPRGMASIKFSAATSASDLTLPLDSPALMFVSQPPDYRVSVQGLPDGLSVKSMTYEKTNLMVDPF